MGIVKVRILKDGYFGRAVQEVIGKVVPVAFTNSQGSVYILGQDLIDAGGEFLNPDVPYIFFHDEFSVVE